MKSVAAAHFARKHKISKQYSEQRQTLHELLILRAQTIVKRGLLFDRFCHIDVSDDGGSLYQQCLQAGFNLSMRVARSSAKLKFVSSINKENSSLNKT